MNGKLRSVIEDASRETGGSLNLPDRLHGKPLLSSAWPWAEQTRALIARKRLTGGAAT